MEALLAMMVEAKASDMHIGVGSPPSFRVDGKIIRASGMDTLNSKQTQALAKSLVTPEQAARFGESHDLDFAYSLSGVGRFRVNLNQRRGSIGLVIRHIPHDIPNGDQLGLPAVCRNLAHKPRGIVLITGPTGSGKSTSLAAIIDYLNGTKDGHILTLEDPIEFIHRDKRCIITQRQIGDDTDSFAQGLRSGLRQDPDVILVGEMRDYETIETALTSAETGHLVLSTLHTNDAPQSVTRLMNMGVPSYNITSAVNLIIAQRLIRKLHKCKVKDDLPKEALLKAGFAKNQLKDLTIYKPNGCADCNEGYRGRTGVFEVMPISDAIARIILEEGNALSIAMQAREENVRDLRHSALNKVADGITDLIEIDRVTRD